MMEWLIDCDILEYCKHSPDERESQVAELPYVTEKPVYVLHLFEVFRAFQLLYRHRGMRPETFRRCWADLSGSYWGGWMHLSEYPQSDFAREIGQIGTIEINADDFPCEYSRQMYWGNEKSLTERIRKLSKLEPVESYGLWNILSPIGHDSPVRRGHSESKDIVVDTNNLIELLNQLPEDGLGANVDGLRLPDRLSESAIRCIKTCIRTYGVANKIIVPLIVVEEAERVANYVANRQNYKRARSVLGAMAFQPDLPLWNIFSFEPLSQNILECFIRLYEGLYSNVGGRQHVLGLADAIILAHGIYNNCPVASNEWFEKEDWNAVAHVFPYLVLRDN